MPAFLHLLGLPCYNIGVCVTPVHDLTLRNNLNPSWPHLKYEDYIVTLSSHLCDIPAFYDSLSFISGLPSRVSADIKMGCRHMESPLETVIPFYNGADHVLESPVDLPLMCHLVQTIGKKPEKETPVTKQYKFLLGHFGMSRVF